MADVTITIRQTNNTSIIVSGSVDDSALAPFTSQLATLLSAAANIPPAPTPAPAPTTTTTTTTTDTPTDPAPVATKRRKTGA